MNLRSMLVVATIVAMTLAAASAADAATPLRNKNNRYKAYFRNWHGDYYHTMWGEPVALVVPPTAGRQTHWAWGVTNTEVRPLWHQFERPYPGPYGGGQGFLPTPRYPSNTNQFGVYSVRGPW